jgi:hypothetical protein
MTTKLDPRARTLTTAHNQITLIHVATTPDGYPGAILQHLPGDGKAPRYTVHVHRLRGWLQISATVIPELGSAKALLKNEYEVSASTYQPSWRPMLNLLNLALPGAATKQAA